MSQFKFNLQAVLVQKQAHEDRCQQELAKVLRQRMIMLDQLRQMQQTITDSKQQLRQGLVGSVDLERTAQFARYSGQVHQRAREFVVNLAMVEGKVEQARGRLLQATRARKALEQLRQRRYRQWQVEQERREQAVLDELGTVRFTRRVMMGEAG